jgi:type III secretory pathway component EscV
MASDFLKKLQESVDSGKPNEAIKAGFNEIVERAEKYASNPETMKAIQDKAFELSEKAAEETAKKLTAEEVMKLNEIAKQQQEKIDKFEQDLKITGALTAIQSKIASLEKEITKYSDLYNEINSDIPFEKKDELIKKLLRDLNG